MASHKLISDYQAILKAELPADLVDEVIDGLAETDARNRERGMNAEDAALAAISEFGDPSVLVDAFSRASAAKRMARILMLSGPGVGLCWAAALIHGRAWQWPVPTAVRLLAGILLVASVIMVVNAVLARRYRSAHRAGLAACIGLGIVDALAIGVVALGPAHVGALIVVAVCASATRFTFVARSVRPVLAGVWPQGPS